MYKLFSTWSSSAPLWLIVLTLIVLQRPIGLFLQHYTVFRCFFHFLNSKMRTFFFSLGIWILKWFAQIYASERVENSNGVDKLDAVCFFFKNEKKQALAYISGSVQSCFNGYFTFETELMINAHLWHVTVVQV